MDKLLLKRTAIQSVALMIAVITLSYALRQYSHPLISASDIGSAEAAAYHQEENIVTAPMEDIPQEPVKETVTPGNNEPDLMDAGLPGMLSNVDPEMIKELGDKLLVIKKPLTEGLKMDLQDIYITKSVKLIFNSSETYQLNEEDIGRIIRQDAFIGTPVFTETEEEVINQKDGSTSTVITKDYGNDIVHSISFIHPDPSKHVTELTLELDTVYAHSIREDETYYYIGLKKPSEVYDRILVLDAGHGGKDAGALSADESIYEKNINLGILLEVKELLDKEDIKVYYTRLGDDKVFLRPRVELANAVDCDYFISIHSNASVSSKPSGTEIFYYGTNFKEVSTKALATIFSEEIEKSTTLTNRGLIPMKKDDIFILNHANVPAILIETGYMTSLKDITYLSQKVNQKAIAKGIYNGILRAYEELKPADRN